MSQKYKDKYIDFKINGRLFPSWVLANFSKFKLPPVIQDENYDPCSRKEKSVWENIKYLLVKF